MTEKERMLSHQLYLSKDPQLKRDRKAVQKLLKRFNKLYPSQSIKRAILIRKIFSEVGAACSVYPPFYCDYGYNIRVGDNFFANADCVILDVDTVTIGNNVMFGPKVMILTASHPFDYSLRKSGYGLGSPIVIEDNVWIGAGAIINSGVKVGSNSIIGSGSVVTRSIPANVIAAGNPCRVLRTISQADVTQNEVL